MEYLNNTQKIKFNEIFNQLNKKLSHTAIKSYNKLPYTTIDGVHDDKSINAPAMWTNGFWPALMMLMYSVTKNEQYLKTARKAGDLLDTALFDYWGLNHDVGFMWDISSGADWRLTKNPTQKNRFLIATNHMMGRFICDGGFFRAWNDEGSEGWAIIDSMMNLPLLYRASLELNDDRFKMAAMKHADITMKYHVREDGSCNHINEYNPRTGEFIKAHGGQGYSDNSSWTRGQAWGIYGFALSYRFTKKPEYLDTAIKIADYFIDNCAKWGYVPPCDFMQSKEPMIYDTTAGVCAACGFLEIAGFLPDDKKEKYISTAVNIILETEKCFCDWSEDEDSIVQCGTEAYTRGIHIPIIYGDYFFVEAVCRLLGYDCDFIW